ncbi:IS3 family transposase [Piscirickettsia salmonis]|uniref:IS3 family transposase n=1 Tax=Piscirickettsia salmonis TaxID=1238 RepID=UPI0009B7DB06|nr:IS3 family transposase [Piscirickettsia salmonis]
MSCLTHIGLKSLRPVCFCRFTCFHHISCGIPEVFPRRNEKIKLCEFDDIHELEDLIAEYIHHYNHERPH